MHLEAPQLLAAALPTLLGPHTKLTTPQRPESPTNLAFSGSIRSRIESSLCCSRAVHGARHAVRGHVHQASIPKLNIRIAIEMVNINEHVYKKSKQMNSCELMNLDKST